MLDTKADVNVRVGTARGRACAIGVNQVVNKKSENQCEKRQNAAGAGMRRQRKTQCFQRFLRKHRVTKK